MVMVDGLGGAHWVLIQYARLCLLGGLGGGARARDHDRDLVGKLLKLACVVEAIAGHYAFYPGRVDAATVDGEQVKAQPGDFYGGWITSRVTGPFKGAPGTLGW